MNNSQNLTADSISEPIRHQQRTTVLVTATLLGIAVLACFLAILTLGGDFFRAKHPPAVLFGALVWVDFFGVFPTAVIVFQGFAKESEWIVYSPQCALQAFFITAFGLSSGAVVTFMSLDRVVSLSKPFFYKQHATPSLTRVISIFLVIFSVLLGVLPLAGVGQYKLNKISMSSCQFDWFPTTLKDTIYILSLGSWALVLVGTMIVSNVLVFVIVIKIRRRLKTVLPLEIIGKRRSRRITLRQEERMAKFVTLASIIFLLTWLPVTIRIFCNVLGALTSEILDDLSIKLVVLNFILDPFTYVLFKRNFKTLLKRSVTGFAAGVLRIVTSTNAIRDCRFSSRIGRRSETRRIITTLELGKLRQTSAWEISDVIKRNNDINE